MCSSLRLAFFIPRVVLPSLPLYSLLPSLRVEQLVVQSLLCQQLFVRPLLQQYSIRQYADQVAVRDRRESMRDRDRQPLVARLGLQSVQCLLHLRLRHRIQGRRGLVQHKNLGVAHQCARNRDALLLAAGDLVPPRPEQLVPRQLVAVVRDLGHLLLRTRTTRRHLQLAVVPDEVHVRLCRDLLHVGVAVLATLLQRHAVQNVVQRGQVEQNRLLSDVPDLLPPLAQVRALQVQRPGLAHFYVAMFRVVVPHQQRHDRGLPAPARARERDALPGVHAQRQALQDRHGRARRVRKVHVLEPHLAEDRELLLLFVPLLRTVDRRHAVDQLENVVRGGLRLRHGGHGRARLPRAHPRENDAHHRAEHVGRGQALVLHQVGAVPEADHVDAENHPVAKAEREPGGKRLRRLPLLDVLD
mmetsp:Transcript_25132/g.63253  ORF Transcript_25132/g.63253 Transcript_25132/m.63253 type:complete len:414 (+) Transcript_25132:905-2146(+)